MNLLGRVYTHSSVTCRSLSDITAQREWKYNKIITDSDSGADFVPKSIELFRICPVFPAKSRANAHRERNTVAILNSE